MVVTHQFSALPMRRLSRWNDGGFEPVGRLIEHQFQTKLTLELSLQLGNPGTGSRASMCVHLHMLDECLAVLDRFLLSRMLSQTATMDRKLYGMHTVIPCRTNSYQHPEQGERCHERSNKTWPSR